ncbi:ATP-binding protein [Streptomyces xiamenensis]|uniref:Regulatory protein n=1 Tax=Streptomyces xiamenensis TaxID=408015 RepID=A0A0F7FW09_9ACTN|nr:MULTISPECIES: ATP-binding protein [Streptomyces]AKG44680.1 regulatory protein [Streptomyces xiamenensis]
MQVQEQVLRTQLEVGPQPSEVRRARQWLRERLARTGMAGEQIDTLTLLVSELVTNAVVHTGRPAVLRLVVREGPCCHPVRLEVADRSALAPRPRSAAQEDTCGRGLELVDLLADRWGWQQEPAGKRVWCEVDCPSGL